MIIDVEGKKAERVLANVSIGQGFATYALYDGTWYSVNLLPDGTINEVRWTASSKERDQIVAVLTARRNS